MVHSSIVQDTLEASIPLQLTLNDGADRAQIYLYYALTLLE